MTNPSLGDSERWVKYHVRCLRADSSLRKISRADRATFIDYVALARWQDPFRGCLCDEDGTPWGRKQRAQLVGESYGSIKRTEEALEAAGLITFQQRGVDHKDSKGRLHIAKYDEYQANGRGYESEGQEATKMEPSKMEPSKMKAKGYEIVASKATKVKAGLSDAGGYESEGQEGESTRGTRSAGDAISGAGGYENEGCAPVDVNRRTDSHNDESLRGQVERQLALVGIADQAFEALWMGVQAMGLPQFDAVVLEATIATTQWALNASRKPNPQAVANYLRKTLRTQAEEEAERDALCDDLDRLHTRLVGPRPRNTHWSAEEKYDRSLREFREDRELWLYRKCGSGDNQQVRERAEELGLWDDGLVERVREKIISGEYAL